ncbi:MAG: hypothetical protein ACLRIS_14570 [Flavonifractor plautii]
MEPGGAPGRGRGTGRTTPEGTACPSPRDRALLARLNTLRRQVAQPLEGLRKNPDKTGRGQAIALYTFLEAAGVPERLAQRTEELNRGAGRAGGGVCPALGDPLRRPGAVRSDPGGRPMELDEFSSSLPWCSPSTTWAPSPCPWTG